MSYDPKRTDMRTRLSGLLLLMGLVLVALLFTMAALSESDLVRYVCLGNGALLLWLGYMIAGAEARIAWFSPELTRLDVVRIGLSSLFVPAFWGYARKGFSLRGAFFALFLCASGAFVGWMMRK